MIRAVMEGFAIFLKDIAEEVRKIRIEPRNFGLSGGLFSITYLRQILADILGHNVRISTGRKASALGAAFLAGIQHGFWKADDIRGMASPGDMVNVKTNPGLLRRYKKWKELHRMTRGLE